MDDLNTQLPQEYQKFTEACLEISRLSPLNVGGDGRQAEDDRTENRDDRDSYGLIRCLRKVMSLPINGRPLSSSSIGQRIGGEIRTAASTFRQLINMPMLAFCNEETFFFFSLFFSLSHTLFFATKFQVDETHKSYEERSIWHSSVLKFLTCQGEKKTFFIPIFFLLVSLNKQDKYFIFHVIRNNLCIELECCVSKRKKEISFFFERIKRSSKQNGNETSRNEASKYARYMVKSRNARTVGEGETRIGKGKKRNRKVGGAKKGRIGRIEGGKSNDVLVVYIAILACVISTR